MQPFKDVLIPYNWVALLTEVIDSRKKGSCLYIVAQENAASRNGHAYFLVDQKGLLKPDLRKLSLSDIVKVSSQILLNAYADFSERKQDYTARVLYGLYCQVSACVLRLIDSRENKDKGMVTSLSRAAAWSLGRASSWIAYQPEFTKRFVATNEAVKRETEDLRTEITHLGEFPIIKELQKRLEKLPSVVKESLRDMRQEDIIQFLTYHISQAIKEKEANPQMACVTPFREDLERGLAFIRRDKNRAISDASSFPRKETPFSKKMNEAIQAIAEIVDQDIWWEAVLQMVVTQTSRNALFNNFKAIFTDQIQQDTWMENGKNYALVFEFNETVQPITLEIKRDAENKIREVNVEVYCIGDLFKMDLEIPPPNGEMVSHNIVTGNMRFTTGRTKEGIPSIRDLTYHLEYLNLSESFSAKL